MLQQIGFGVKFIKDFNELNVLRFIKQNNPISRAAIAKKQHISKAAVSEIVGRLIEQGYIQECGLGTSTLKGGRKPVLLNFNTKAAYVIAMEIRRTYSRVSLVDINAHIHKTKTIIYSAGTRLQDVIKNIFPVIDQFLDTPWVKKSKAIGIGIGIPGLIDYECGCIKMCDTLKIWEF